MICPWTLAVSISCMVPLFFQSGYCAEVIDGREVKPHSLPHMALLETSTGARCGGILIHPKWVLTAAHCQGIKKVLLGVHNITQDEKDSRQIRKVKGHVPHPCFNFTEKTNDHDLMLLKLDKAVKPTPTVRLLAVPGSPLQEPPAGTGCLVAGWGKKNNRANSGSDVLMSANVTVVDRTLCNSAEYYNSRPVITSGMICAGSADKSRSDTCQGDSGGPLVCDGTLVGVTSFGKGCGVKKKPGVYAFLSEGHINWIRKTIHKAEV